MSNTDFKGIIQDKKRKHSDNNIKPESKIPKKGANLDNTLNNGAFPEFLTKLIEKNIGFKFKPDLTKDPVFNESHDLEKYDLNIKHPEDQMFEKHLKKMKSLAWLAEEVPVQKDIFEFNTKLSKDQQELLLGVLGFFRISDDVVCENITENMMNAFKRPHIRACYVYQATVESNVHTPTYQRLFEAFSTKETDPNFFQSAIAAKTRFAKEWVENKDISIHERLVIWGAFESVSFSSSFCIIGYFEGERLLMEGTVYANRKISTDENTHCQLAWMIYKILVDKLPQWRIQQIFAKIVELEIEYVKTILKVDFPGMTQKAMIEYVKYVADSNIVHFGAEPIYGAKNPFNFMDNWSADRMTSFFEQTRNADYSARSVGKTEWNDSSLKNNF